MVGFSCWDEVPMVSTRVCMVIYWTRPMVSHDIRLSSSHGFTKLRSCTFSQPWENIEFVQKLAVTFTYKWYPMDCVIVDMDEISVIMDISVNILTQNIDRPKIHQNLWKCKKKLLKMKLEV